MACSLGAWQNISTIIALSRIPSRKCLSSDCTPSTLDVCPVRKELIADPTEGHNLVPDQIEWLEEWALEELQNWQWAETSINRVIEWLKSSHDSPSWKGMVRSDNTIKGPLFIVGKLKMDNGILCREWYPQGTGRGARSVLHVLTPSEVCQRILQSLQNSPSGGHLGRTNTLLRVRQRFYWPYYKEDVIHWRRRCDLCARSMTWSNHNACQNTTHHMWHHLA